MRSKLRSPAWNRRRMWLTSILNLGICPLDYLLGELECRLVLLASDRFGKARIPSQDSVSRKANRLRRSNGARYAGFFESGQQLLNVVGVWKIRGMTDQYSLQRFLHCLLGMEAENLRADQIGAQSSGVKVVLREPEPLKRMVRMVRMVAGHGCTLLCPLRGLGGLSGTWHACIARPAVG